ncbi:MAG: hypothetical protein PF542_01360 [Nanoarchaeota archaeon]|jgi:hypothetical protein|nr:hypothetical protein [Nanoarchaeota archaeon]
MVGRKKVVKKKAPVSRKKVVKKTASPTKKVVTKKKTTGWGRGYARRT